MSDIRLEEEVIRKNMWELYESGAIPTVQQNGPVAWAVPYLIPNFSRNFSAYQTGVYTVPLYTSPTLPEGWQIVPKTLTNEIMGLLDFGVTVDDEETAFEHFQRQWDEILAVAPKPEDVK